MNMTDVEFRSFLDLMMCSDPWPASEKAHAALDGFADRQSKAHGYEDWIEAYHCFEPDPFTATQEDATRGGTGIG
jgi:hypothetical protein